MDGAAQGRGISADRRGADAGPPTAAVETARSTGTPGQVSGNGPTRRTTVALVVPTRNEAPHVEEFVRRVDAALGPFPIDWHAEVIDDSNDDTPRIFRELASRGAPVEVTHRHENARGGGLGAAIREGLIRARGEIVCVIDADLQHPPEILPELLAPIALGRADICVGSRYRRGGSAAGLGSRWRRLAARCAGAAARRLLPATRLTSDPGSGLFAVRREVIDSAVLRARGSRVLAEILVRGQWRTVCDVPYRFAVVDDGSARLSTADALDAARELTLLWRSRRRVPAPSAPAVSRGRQVDSLPGRRRVAPVHVELLRASPEPVDGAEVLSRSR